MSIKILTVWACLLLSPLVACAELAVCFDAARPLGSQFQHNPSIDPLKVTNPLCSVVTKASGRTQQQLTLINSTIRGVPASRYLKVVGGYAEQMSVAEMDAVDAFLTQQAAAQQVFVDEVHIQDFCGLTTLDEVDTRVDAYYNGIQATMQTDVNAIDIAAINTAVQAITNATTSANILAIKNALTVMGQQLNTTKTALTTVAMQLAQERTTTKKTLRCLLSVRKGAR